MNAPTAIPALTFSAPYKEFRAAVEAAARIGTQRSTIPVMECVLVTARDGVLTVEASDTVQAVRSIVPADIECEGSAAIPARELKSFCSSAKGDGFDIAFHGGRFSIRCGGAFVSLMDLPAETYPAWSFDVQERDVDGATLAAAMTFCAAAAERSDLFPEKSSICIHPKGIAAFDGNRMHVAAMDTGHRSAMIRATQIPGLSNVLSAEGATFGIGQSSWQCTSNGVTIAARTIAGDWPLHLIDLMTTGDLSAVVEHSDILSSIKTSTLGGSSCASIEISDETLKISAKIDKKAGVYVGSGSSEVPASVSSAIETKINPDFLVAAVSALPEYPVALFYTPSDGKMPARLAVSPDQESLTCKLTAYMSEMRL